MTSSTGSIPRRREIRGAGSARETREMQDGQGCGWLGWGEEVTPATAVSLLAIADLNPMRPAYGNGTGRQQLLTVRG